MGGRYEAICYDTFRGSPPHGDASSLLQLVGKASSDGTVPRDDAMRSSEWLLATLLELGFVDEGSALRAPDGLCETLIREQNSARTRVHQEAAVKREALLSSLIAQAATADANEASDVSAGREALRALMADWGSAVATGPLLMGAAALLRAQASSADRCQVWSCSRATVLNGGDEFCEPAIRTLRGLALCPAEAAVPEALEQGGASEEMAWAVYALRRARPVCTAPRDHPAPFAGCAWRRPQAVCPLGPPGHHLATIPPPSTPVRTLTHRSHTAQQAAWRVDFRRNARAGGARGTACQATADGRAGGGHGPAEWRALLAARPRDASAAPESISLCSCCDLAVRPPSPVVQPPTNLCSSHCAHGAKGTDQIASRCHTLSRLVHAPTAGGRSGCNPCWVLFSAGWRSSALPAEGRRPCRWRCPWGAAAGWSELSADRSHTRRERSRCDGRVVVAQPSFSGAHRSHTEATWFVAPTKTKHLRLAACSLDLPCQYARVQRLQRSDASRSERCV